MMTKPTEELLERGSYFEVGNPVFLSSLIPMKSLMKLDTAEINVPQIATVFDPENQTQFTKGRRRSLKDIRSVIKDMIKFKNNT